MQRAPPRANGWSVLRVAAGSRNGGGPRPDQRTTGDGPPDQTATGPRGPCGRGRPFRLVHRSQLVVPIAGQRLVIRGGDGGPHRAGRRWGTQGGRREGTGRGRLTGTTGYSSGQQCSGKAGFVRAAHSATASCELELTTGRGS